MPPNQPCVCLPLSRTFPVAMATPLGRPALLCIPGIEQEASPHPLRQRDGVYPTMERTGPTGERTGLLHSDIQSTSSGITNAPGTKPGPARGEEISHGPALTEHTTCRGRLTKGQAPRVSKGQNSSDEGSSSYVLGAVLALFLGG